jgi:hypothetical protein
MLERQLTKARADEVPWEEPKPVAKKAPAPVVEEDEDEDLAMFRKLADD